MPSAGLGLKPSHYAEALAAPVRQGQVMGTLALELDRQPYAEYPLVALREIGTGNIFQRTIDRVQLWLQ